jgi:hypothetical protein
MATFLLATKAARTVETRPTWLMDYATTGEPIGVELTASLWSETPQS